MNTRPKSKARIGSGSIRLRGNKWEVRWREVRRNSDGSSDYIQHSEFTGSDDRDYAQKILNRKLEETGGRRPATVDPDKVSYENLRQNWLAFKVEQKSRTLKYGKDGQVGHDTLSRLDVFFGGNLAGDITLADLRRFRKDTLEDGAGDARINRCMATLRGMFNQGRKDELITQREIPPYFPMVKESVKAREKAFIEPEFYEPLRKVLNEPLRSAFTLAYHNSVRVQEMKRIPWRDIDFKRKQIFLSEEVTKSGEARIVPLPSDFNLKPGNPDDFPLAGIGERRESTWNEACVQVGAGWFECRACGARCTGRDCLDHGRRAVRGVIYHGPQLRNTRHTAVRAMSDAGM